MLGISGRELWLVNVGVIVNSFTRSILRLDRDPLVEIVVLLESYRTRHGSSCGVIVETSFGCAPVPSHYAFDTVVRIFNPHRAPHFLD